jgi:membrane protein
VGPTLGLSAAATKDLQLLLSARNTVRETSTELGALLTLLSAHSWPKAFHHGHEIAGRLPPSVDEDCGAAGCG